MTEKNPLRLLTGRVYKGDYQPRSGERLDYFETTGRGWIREDRLNSAEYNEMVGFESEPDDTEDPWIWVQKGE